MSTLTRMLVTTAGRAAARRLDHAARDPQAAQLSTLLEILQRNRDTEYGREHNFAAVRSMRDYRTAAPVVTYDDIGGRIERMARGERHILTAETPIMFARTSGTTGNPKYIPVTPTCQRRTHRDQTRAWLFHALRDHPTLFDHKVLSLVSPAVEGHTPGGIPFGSTSGAMYRDMPWVVRSTYAIPYPIFEIDDYELKYSCILQIALAQDVSLIATANPSSVLKLCELAERDSDTLLRNLSEGTIQGESAMPMAVQRALRRLGGSRPERAAALDEARRRRGGRLMLGDCWPGLALIACWKGGTVGHYLDRLEEYFNPDDTRAVPVRDWGYLSSEARASIPISDQGCGGVLAVGSNVYEFVPEDIVERCPDDWKAWDFLDAHELREGQSYYIILTTTGGLYRYDINDVVTVVGWHRRTPLIAFVRKGRGVTSITGEKVSVEQVIEAFERCTRNGATRPEHYKAEARVDEVRYVFKVELPAESASAHDLRHLLTELDRHLAELNIEYAAKRQSGRLRAPALQVMRNGWYEHAKSAQARGGGRTFQAKTILLSDREDDHDNQFVAQTIEFDVDRDRARKKAVARARP